MTRWERFAAQLANIGQRAGMTRWSRFMNWLAGCTAPAATTRRGAFLLLVGIIYTVIGTSYAVLPIPKSSARGYSMAASLAHFFGFPLSAWGWVWAAVGLCGILAAWFPMGLDVWGYYVMVAFSTMWSVLSACSSLFEGAGRGWFLALIWGTFALALAIVSGMDVHKIGRK